MNDKTIQKHVAEIEADLHRLDVEQEELRARLRRLQPERDMLQSLLKAYGQWPSQGRVLSPAREPGRGMRQVMVGVLKDAGKPLHSQEIWRQAQQMGIETTAKDPVAAIDAAGYNIREARKVGPRTWEYIGQETGPEEETA